MLSLTKSVVLVFCTVLFSLGALSQVLPPATWLQRIHPLTGSTLVATPDNGHIALVQAIKAAKQSVEMEIYHLTDPEMVQTLIDARAKKVNVRVIYDARSLQNSHYQQFYDQLISGGVAVVKSSLNFSITHSKTFLIDRKLLFVSTMNFVGHFDNMRDFGLFTTDQDMIREWLTIFQTDLQNSQANTSVTPPLNNPNLVISPVNSEQKIIDLINVSRASIHGTVENLGSNNVIMALANASKRGVKIRLITPECDLNTNPLFNYPALYTLAKSGVENRLMPTPSTPQTPYMHAKTLVIDSRVAFLGSENFSFNSLSQAREIGVVFSSPNLVLGLDNVFGQDWLKSRPLPPTPPTYCKAPGA
jgi:phosphatidylserine/phosphatidylglycerophosphate/cardiolipin synthase-like enzyme